MVSFGLKTEQETIIETVRILKAFNQSYYTYKCITFDIISIFDQDMKQIYHLMLFRYP